MITVFKDHSLQPHFFANEPPEFVGGYFSQTLKPGDLRFCSQFPDRRLFFRFVVTIDRFFFISYPEKWRFQHKYMFLLYKIGEELQKESHQQEANMHAIDIG